MIIHPPARVSVGMLLIRLTCAQSMLCHSLFLFLFQTTLLLLWPIGTKTVRNCSVIRMQNPIPAASLVQRGQNNRNTLM